MTSPANGFPLLVIIGGNRKHPGYGHGCLRRVHPADSPPPTWKRPCLAFRANGSHRGEHPRHYARGDRAGGGTERGLGHRGPGPAGPQATGPA
jgi:hypothetical protein